MKEVVRLNYLTLEVITVDFHPQIREQRVSKVLYLLKISWLSVRIILTVELSPMRLQSENCSARFSVVW